MSRRWHFVKRPQGPVTPDCFELREVADRSMGPGLIRVRNRLLSLDPSTRWRMQDDNPLVPLPLGAPFDGPALGEVVESESASFAPGDLVVHMAGWRDEAVLPESRVTSVPKVPAPDTAFMGVLGYPGMTAYFGLVDVARVKPGDVLFVSGAAGAVGTAVIQMAKCLGARVVASAGGPEKCALARELGADATIDYKAVADLAGALREAAPDGIDVYFDNVGGDHLDAALQCAGWRARFAICGMIGQYDGAAAPPLPHLDRVISSELTLRGFEVFSYLKRQDEFVTAAGEWFEAGKLRSVETVREGLENIPSAFAELFTGGNVGKLLVRV